MLCNFLTKIVVPIFDFNGSGRLGRERNLYPGGGGLMVKNKERGGGGE